MSAENPKKTLNYKDFKSMFSYDENERDKKALKKEFKHLDKEHNGKIKFKHLIGKKLPLNLRLLPYIVKRIRRLTPVNRCWKDHGRSRVSRRWL